MLGKKDDSRNDLRLKKSGKIDQDKAYCSGEDFSKHPGIYMKFQPGKNEVKCIYCGKVFLKNEQN